MRLLHRLLQMYLLPTGRGILSSDFIRRESLVAVQPARSDIARRQLSPVHKWQCSLSVAFTAPPTIHRRWAAAQALGMYLRCIGQLPGSSNWQQKESRVAVGLAFTVLTRL